MNDTCLGGALLPILSFASKLDGTAAEFANQAGIDTACLRLPDSRVPIDKAEYIWGLVLSAAKGKGEVALSIARQLTPTMLHSIGFAWLASGSLREACDRFARHRLLISPRGEFFLREEAGLVWLCVRNGALEQSDSLADEARLAGLLVMLRTIAGESLQARAVHLPRVSPPASGEWKEFFGVEPVTDVQEWAFAIDVKDFDAPLMTANPAMASAAERQAEESAARLRDRDIISRVRHSLMKSLADGECSLPSVAKRLALSEKTLQRRLAERGIAFAKLLDTLRLELATDHLRRSHVSIQEISWLLGFSEIASFSRAFRRWTGLSPSDWRSRALPDVRSPYVALQAN